ncbi:hypothetical protein HMPREF9153_1243 [Cutibacterium avidum ATCC 25577]|uniref:Uncharacterized protein n=1 Tax=Cutibacterium avidum ATCC 25577 TaxID=997355 RepID=G4CXI6_9ACTN|nr:hypothetical protein HMPREF9153_1243 [Cutibacterium avidum ATCC 25577]
MTSGKCGEAVRLWLRVSWRDGFHVRRSPPWPTRGPPCRGAMQPGAGAVKPVQPGIVRPEKNTLPRVGCSTSLRCHFRRAGADTRISVISAQT